LASSALISGFGVSKYLSHKASSGIMEEKKPFFFISPISSLVLHTILVKGSPFFTLFSSPSPIFKPIKASAGGLPKRCGWANPPHNILISKKGYSASLMGVISPSKTDFTMAASTSSSMIIS